MQTYATWKLKKNKKISMTIGSDKGLNFLKMEQSGILKSSPYLF